MLANFNREGRHVVEWLRGGSLEFLGPGLMLLFIAICATMTWFTMHGEMMHRKCDSHAVGVLKERCAWGEINHTKYEERRRLLES